MVHKESSTFHHLPINDRCVPVCGGCRCEEGYSGRSCECGGHGDESALDMCERDDEGKVCSGHGQCKCGRCLCDAEHVGRNCECMKDEVSEEQGNTCSPSLSLLHVQLWIWNITVISRISQFVFQKTQLGKHWFLLSVSAGNRRQDMLRKWSMHVRCNDRGGDPVQVLLPRPLEGRQLWLHYGHDAVQGTLNLHMMSTPSHYLQFLPLTKFLLLMPSCNPPPYCADLKTLYVHASQELERGGVLWEGDVRVRDVHLRGGVQGTILPAW